jgi:hypothetical protein
VRGGGRKGGGREGRREGEGKLERREEGKGEGRDREGRSRGRKGRRARDMGRGLMHDVIVNTCYEGEMYSLHHSLWRGHSHCHQNRAHGSETGHSPPGLSQFCRSAVNSALKVGNIIRCLLYAGKLQSRSFLTTLPALLPLQVG